VVAFSSVPACTSFSCVSVSAMLADRCPAPHLSGCGALRDPLRLLRNGEVVMRDDQAKLFVAVQRALDHHAVPQPEEILAMCFREAWCEGDTHVGGHGVFSEGYCPVSFTG